MLQPDQLNKCFDLGWSFCCLKGKIPVQAKWQSAPRADLATIQRWLRNGHNLGLRTGQISGGVVAVDIDNGADVTGLDLPDTVQVRTGSGGTHLYYLSDVPLRNSVGKIAPHVDFRGDGGQVVFPGSVHPDTLQKYEFTRSPWEIPVAPLPAWIKDTLTAPRPTHPPPPIATPAPKPTNGITPYAAAALAGESATVAAAQPGSRNHTLYTAALKLGGLVAAGALPENDVKVVLATAAISAGLPEDEALKTLSSGLAAGMTTPRVLPEPTHKPAPPDAPPPDQSSEPEASAAPENARHCTDIGNAERFAARNIGKILFDCALQGWRVWNGRAWAADNTGAVTRLAVATARSIRGEAMEATDKDQADSLWKWAHRSESRERLSAMMDLARAIHPMATPGPRFDADPWLFNCANGTLDLRTGKLRTFSPTDLITRQSPIAFDPVARHELFDRVLTEALPDPDLRTYLQLAAGYSLCGSTREEVMFFIYGPEASAKSTFTEALSHVLGGYSTTADPETFLKKQGDAGVRQDIARLAGLRLVLTSEVDAGKQFAEGLVKRITGGDVMVARYLYGKEFCFRPQFKLWLVANHQPRADAQDGALWRRIRVLPFDRSIPKEQRDPTVKQTMLTECGPALLAWAVQGCLLWQKNGLRDAPRVANATEQYRADQDPLSGFFSDRCHFIPTAWTMSKDIFNAYHAWAAENGVSTRFQVSPKRLAEALKQRGCLSQHFRDGFAWSGISL